MPVFKIDAIYSLRRSSQKAINNFCVSTLFDHLLCASASKTSSSKRLFCELRAETKDTISGNDQAADEQFRAGRENAL